MSNHQALMEAVHRLREHEQEVVKYRTEVANLLSEAVEKDRVTDLADITGIGRTTIYWLIRVWSNKPNENRNT